MSQRFKSKVLRVGRHDEADFTSGGFWGLQFFTVLLLDGPQPVVKFKASEESALFQVGDEVEVLWNEVEQKPVQVRNLTIEKLRNPAPVLKRRPAPGR